MECPYCRSTVEKIINVPEEQFSFLAICTECTNLVKIINGILQYPSDSEIKQFKEYKEFKRDKILLN
jgi:hypothetical protein